MCGSDRIVSWHVWRDRRESFPEGLWRSDPRSTTITNDRPSRADRAAIRESQRPLAAEVTERIATIRPKSLRPGGKLSLRSLPGRQNATRSVLDYDARKGRRPRNASSSGPSTVSGTATDPIVTEGVRSPW